MRVLLKVQSASDAGIFKAGDQADLPYDQAIGLIDEGFAISLEPEQIETAESIEAKTRKRAVRK